MRVALLFGGVSNEHDISRRSCANLYSIIKNAGHRPVPIYITREGAWRLFPDSPTQILQGDAEGTPLLLSPPAKIYTDTARALAIDVVFPCLHGQYGEDGTIQGLLEALGIPYIGCKREASVLGMNKRLAKALARQIGVPTLPTFPLKRDTPLDAIPLPAFCKASRSGSSIGTALARTRDELKEAISTALAIDGDAFAEPFVEARELEVAVLDDGKRTVSLPGEICKSGAYYDFRSKYLSPIATKTVASLPQELTAQAQEYASSIFDALGCRHLARVDFFLLENQIYFNEVNTLPGFTSDSLYLSMLEAAGVPPREAIDRLVRAAI